MARQRYDIGSKWLLQNHGKSALLLGGLHDVRRVEPMPGEVVQNRRYPDGLLQAFLGSDPKPHHVLIEIATYPEKRALRQALDDLALAYSTLGHLPELLMLVLRPKGKFRIQGRHEIASALGLSRMEVEWRTVELWTLPAEQFLAEGDVGIVPWVPLMECDKAPNSLLRRCASRIEKEADVQQRTDMLVISQLMAGLRFPTIDVSAFFCGDETMLESPILGKWMAMARHQDILEVLKERFDSVPRDVHKQLGKITDEKRLRKLVRLAVKCADLDAFRDALSTEA